MKTFSVATLLLTLVVGWTFAIVGPYDVDGGNGVPLQATGLFADIVAGIEIQVVKSGLESLKRAVGILSANATGVQKAEGERLLAEAEAAFLKGRDIPAAFAASTYGLAIVNDMRGQTGNALDLLTEGVRQRPDDAVILNYQGWLLRKAGRLQESVSAYTAAVKGTPALPDVRRGLADVLVVMCRYGEAAEVCRQGVAQWPDYEWLADTLVKVLSLDGQKEEAAKTCQDFMERHPEWVRLRYRHGQLLLRAGRKEEGRAEMRAVIKTDPNFCQAYNELGMAAMDEKEYQVALVFFRNGLKVHPDCVSILENMASSYLSIGDSDKALETVKLARRVNASSDQGAQTMANALIDKGDYTNALAVCEDAIRSRPWSGEFHSTASICLGKMGRKEEALEAARKGTVTGKPVAFVWEQYAIALNDCKRFEEAAEAYGKAALLKPDTLNYVIGRASALFEGGRVEEANAECEAWLRRFPDSLRMLESYGVLLEKQRRYDDAFTYYKKAAEVKPVPDADKAYAGCSWGYLGRIYVRREKWGDALEAFKTAASFDPASPLWCAGQVLVESKLDPDRARRTVDDSLKRFPGNDKLLCQKAEMVLRSGTEKDRREVLAGLDKAEVNENTLYLRGVLEKELGNVEKAEAFWRELVRGKPQWASPYDELGKMLLKKDGPTDEVLALHAKAVELSPESAVYHNNLGYDYLMAGQHEPALRELQKAVELKPGFGLAYYNLGLVRYAMGQYDKAALSVLRARELGYAGERGFVLQLAERVKFMKRSKTNSPAFGPQL
ncbi:MAG TPA: tetratricopeptide repeat protein [Kiritimatiellia bacterium]|nr:tetratricopeptide repeat protein [Kiritimatiellia bacterium]